MESTGESVEWKSKEAVETNAKIDRLLLAVNSAFDSLVERKNDFNATDVKEMLQGSKDTQMTLLKLFDRHIEEVKSRVGIDISHRTLPNYIYTRNRLAEFINCRFKVSDLAFCQLNELFIREFQEYVVIEKRLGVQTVRHYLAILKRFAVSRSRKDIRTSPILNTTSCQNRKRHHREH